MWSARSAMEYNGVQWSAMECNGAMLQCCNAAMLRGCTAAFCNFCTAFSNFFSLMCFAMYSRPFFPLSCTPPFNSTSTVSSRLFFSRCSLWFGGHGSMLCQCQSMQHIFALSWFFSGKRWHLHIPATTSSCSNTTAVTTEPNNVSLSQKPSWCVRTSKRIWQITFLVH